MSKVDKIIKSFTKTVVNLNKVVDQELSQMDMKTKQIKQLKAECNDHAAEAARATKISRKLSDLFDG